MWNGRYDVVAIQYERYVILKHYAADSNERKSVFFKLFTYMTNWNISGTSHISDKRVLGS
jgi:hypothetical protein